MDTIEVKESNSSIPAIMDDKLIQIAEQAERRIDAVKKIKSVALKVTNAHDWVDQGGKPYLQASGSEKVARLFGISWRINEPTYDEDGDGHFSFTYRGEFSFQDVSIEAIGTRGSKDKFFSRSHGKDIPPSEIDKGNVKKAAYTNLLGNGITRLLGIRNLAYEDLAATGITKAMVTRFEYKSGKKPPSGGQKSPSGQSTQTGNDTTGSGKDKLTEAFLSSVEEMKKELVMSLGEGAAAEAIGNALGRYEAESFEDVKKAERGAFIAYLGSLKEK